MLADMAMKVEAARLMVYNAAARAERGEGNLGFISAASKCLASDVAMEVTTDAVQLFGGAGYTVDFPVERMMRDAKITQIYEGTNQIQRVVMSRALLKYSYLVRERAFPVVFFEVSLPGEHARGQFVFLDACPSR